ncbi:Crp/Fnr family transcriptional regulator [Pedobacter ginsengiterrae]|uniref:Crp/Fnr family transcriptional regulator n=1 Tax=Pedobacter ginsengiterrae TaxID=871696 RepID=UPI0031D328C5
MKVNRRPLRKHYQRERFDLILHNIGRHIKLTVQEEKTFTGMLEAKNLKIRDFLLRQGEVCQFETFIVKGCLRMYSTDEEGVEHVVLIGIENWWICDLGSFLGSHPANYSIDALENSEVMMISRENLEQLYTRVSKFERFFRILFQNAYIAQQNRTNQDLTLNGKMKYLSFLQKYPTLDQRISQRQIASFLGITPVFLSMIRRKIVSRSFVKLV